MKKALLLFLLTLLCPLFALAEDFCVMDADSPGPVIATGLPIGAVSVWHENRDQAYLFLPANLDPQRLRVALPEDESLIVNDIAIYNDDITNLFIPGQTLSVTTSSGSYSLTVLQSSDIPALFLSTASGESAFIHADKANREPGELLMSMPDGAVVYDGALEQLRIRGNTTSQYPKKPYQFKLAHKTALTGGDKGKSWALLANYIDHSLLRNTVALTLAEAAGLSFVSECTPVDVYLNNEYMGSYLLCETVTIGSSRVDIADLEDATEAVNRYPLEAYPSAPSDTLRIILDAWFIRSRWSPIRNTHEAIALPNNPEDITGGYLLEIGIKRDWDEQLCRFVTNSGWPLVVKEPKYASVEQVTYIQSKFQQLDNALANPERGWEMLQGVANVDSFVRKYVLEELLINFDGGTGSQYFYKDTDSRDPLIYCGPPWDYDNTLGVNSTVCDPARFYVQTRTVAPAALFPRLWKIPEFQEASMEVYWDVFRPLVDELLGNAEGEHLTAITELADEIEDSAAMNFIRWPIAYAFHHQVRNTGNTWEENIEDLLSFLEQRVAFLDEAWAQ